MEGERHLIAYLGIQSDVSCINGSRSSSTVKPTGTRAVILVDRLHTGVFEQRIRTCREGHSSIEASARRFWAGINLHLA